MPVKHGEDMDCLGFMFGTSDVVVYLSDISRMLPDTMTRIVAAGAAAPSGRVALLVLDALHPSREYFSHFTQEQALALAREIRAEKTLLIGMGSGFDHDRDNARLASLLVTEGLDVQLARDGLKLHYNL